MEASEPNRAVWRAAGLIRRMGLSSFSIEALIRLAFKYGLLTDYRMTSRFVRLHAPSDDGLSPGAAFELDPEQARCFLSGMIHGYYLGRDQGDQSQEVEGDRRDRRAGTPGSSGTG